MNEKECFYYKNGLNYFMRLYVKNKQGDKKYLDITAQTRQELSHKIGYSFAVNDEYYSLNEVFAEHSSSDTAGGAVIGGLFGLLGGGVGVIVGGLAGGIIGGLRDKEEQEKVNKFNNSFV